MIRMLADYTRHYLGLKDEGQGTVEYTILSGVAVLGLVLAFNVLNVGATLATWLQAAINGVTPPSN
jgi:hypothetical protein